jgi:hypothetical protein
MQWPKSLLVSAPKARKFFLTRPDFSRRPKSGRLKNQTISPWYYTIYDLKNIQYVFMICRFEFCRWPNSPQKRAIKAIVELLAVEWLAISIF